MLGVLERGDPAEEPLPLCLRVRPRGRGVLVNSDAFIVIGNWEKPTDFIV